MRNNELPCNHNEEYFKSKMEEYNELIKKRDNCKIKIKEFKNTIMYLNNIDNDKNIFGNKLNKLKIHSHSDIFLGDYLRHSKLTEKDCPTFYFDYNVKEDMDMILNILNSIIETWHQRYEVVNEQIKNFKFL